MKAFSVGMQASFTPEQQMALWNALGGDITAYIGRQKAHIATRFGSDFTGLPNAIGEWQKQMGQFASPPAAAALIDATVTLDPLLTTRPGSGRMRQGLQLLAHRAPQSTGKLAGWLTGTKGVAIRELIPVQQDGTGAGLSEAVIAQMRQKGTDPRALADMESLYRASLQNVQERQGQQLVSDQFKLFNQNRAGKLQNIFDSALREGGALYTQRHNFGNDPAADAAYGQRLGLAPDNPNAGPGQAAYTDPGKLAKIRELKQIDLISRALSLPVDLNALTPLIANGQALPKSESLAQINKLREWVREAGGENAYVTFTPAVYASETHGVSPLHLIRVEGDKNRDGVITRAETTRTNAGNWTSERLADEDVIIDASMAAAAAKGQNVPWKYNDLQNFRDDNLLDDEGKLYFAVSPDGLLHDANGDGRVDKIDFEGVDAAITSAWETTRRWGDVVVGVAGLVAGVALIVGTGGLAAPVVAGGAALYFGARTVETGAEMYDHGQSFNPISTADGAWLGVIDPAAGGLWLGGIASVSGLGALRPLALGKSLVGFGQTGTLARGATAANGLRTNVGAELFLNKGLQTSIYQAQLATVPKAISWTAQGSGGLMTVGQGQDFVRAAANGEIDWTDWSIDSATWDFALMGGGVASFGAGYAAAAHARARARSQNMPAQMPDNAGQGGSPGDGDGGATPASPTGDAAITLPQLAPADLAAPAPVLTGKDVAALTGDGLAALTPDLPPDLLAHINPDEMPNLKPAQLAAFTGDQVAALTANRLMRLSPEQIQALGKTIARIAPGRLHRLSPQQTAAMTREQMGWLTVHQVAGLSRAQLAAFTPEQLGSLTIEQRHAISPSQKMALGEPQLQALDRPTLNTPFGEVALTYRPSEPAPRAPGKGWHKLPLEEIPNIPGRRIAQLSAKEMARFTPEQIAMLTREQQMWITADQMAGFTAEQLAALHPLQLGSFTPEQRGALKADQTRLLNEAQAGALSWRWLDGQFGPISMPDVVPTEFNHFAPTTLLGLPRGRASSPLHEVAHLFPGRLIRTLETRGGVESAAAALKNRDHVMLVTGFSVAKGMPETDGPPGTALLGRILRQSGKKVTYVTDAANAPVLKATLAALGEPTDNVQVFSAPHWGQRANKRAAQLLDKVKPDAVMAIELPGRNVDGVRKNMRGIPIDGFNPPLDAIVLQAYRREGIVTLGVGDGGNESGMGVVRQLVPPDMKGGNMASNVPAHHLVTASVSNWGAEAVGAAYAKLIGRTELVHTPEQQRMAIDASAEAGAVDGVTRLQVASADGFSWEAHQGWHIQLDKAVQRTHMDPIYLAMMDSSDGGLYAARTFAELLTEATGRRVVRVLGLDHANAPYGKIAIDPEQGPQQIGRLTNNVLRTLTRVLSGTASDVTIAMACNTACTGIDYAANLTGATVVDLVQITAREMVKRQGGPTGPYAYGDHVVSLSTGGTQEIHAYRDAVSRLDRDMRITEIGATAKPMLRDGRQHPGYDLADIVNKMNTAERPSEAAIQEAVDYYVDQIPADATSVWLTCTHYPALTSYIETALARRGLKIPVINPMRFQVAATIEKLGIQVLEKRPAHFQRTRPPVVVTSGNAETVLGSARAVLGREDVRVFHVDDFANVPDRDIAEIRHAIFRANNPADGTLHELSVKVDGKWVPVEVLIRDAEAGAYKTLDHDKTLQNAYENVLRAIAGYGPVDPPPPGGQPPIAGQPGGEPPNFKGQLLLAAKEYGPLFATTGALAATVPTEYLVVANGVSWVVRGAATLPTAIWPNSFAVNTRAGRALRFVNALTFIGNGSYHAFTYVDGAGLPMNQLYAISDHGSLMQNAHEARTGRADSPPKWAKYTTLAAANTANALLLPFYSIPVGFEAWGPNLLFGGGTAYLTYKAFGGGKGHKPIYARVATGAAALGLLTFGVTYLKRLSDERAKAGPNGAAAIPADQQGLYEELFARPIEGGVYAAPFGRIILIEQDGALQAIIVENEQFVPVRQQIDADAMRSGSPPR
jgi:glutamate racemase